MTRRRGQTTTQSGLGWSHQKERTAALAAFVDGTPCPFCRKPMYRWQRLHLDHSVPRCLGGDGPRRLAHGPCNESAGARARSQARRQRERPPLGTPSRQW